MRRRWIQTALTVFGAVGMLVGFPSSSEACLFCWLFHPWCPPQASYGPVGGPGYAAPAMAQYGPPSGVCGAPTQTFYAPTPRTGRRWAFSPAGTCNGPVQTFSPPAASCAAPREAFYPPAGTCGFETGPPAPAAQPGEAPRTYRERPATGPGYEEQPSDQQDSAAGDQQDGQDAAARTNQWRGRETRKPPMEETAQSTQDKGNSIIRERGPAPMNTPDSSGGSGAAEQEPAGGENTGVNESAGPSLGRLQNKITWRPAEFRKRLRVRRQSGPAGTAIRRRKLAENAGWVPVRDRADGGVKVSAAEAGR